MEVENEIRAILKPVADVGNDDVGDYLEDAIVDLLEFLNQEVIKARIDENEEWLEIVEPDHEEWFKDRIADLKATLANTESNKEGVEVND